MTNKIRNTSKFTGRWIPGPQLPRNRHRQWCCVEYHWGKKSIKHNIFRRLFRSTQLFKCNTSMVHMEKCESHCVFSFPIVQFYSTLANTTLLWNVARNPTTQETLRTLNSATSVSGSTLTSASAYFLMKTVWMLFRGGNVRPKDAKDKCSLLVAQYGQRLIFQSVISYYLKCKPQISAALKTYTISTNHATSPDRRATPDRTWRSLFMPIPNSLIKRCAMGDVTAYLSGYLQDNNTQFSQLLVSHESSDPEDGFLCWMDDATQ